jgi:small subunit ribosomal protein S20
LAPEERDLDPRWLGEWVGGVQAVCFTVMASVACTAVSPCASISISAWGSNSRHSSVVSLRSCRAVSSSCFLGNRLQWGGGCATRVLPPLVIRRPVLVRAAAAPATKKPDQAEKRARQNEKHRLYNKSRKSEVHTRMKKVFVALDGLKKKGQATSEDIAPVESLIAEAFSIIDKAVKVGTIHRNKGGHQKSRLSRAKKALEIQLGLYSPVAAS